MNFHSLIDNPVFKHEPERLSGSYTSTDSYLSPPPSPKSPEESKDDEKDEHFQQNIKFNTPLSQSKPKIQFSTLNNAGNSKNFPIWFQNNKQTTTHESSLSVNKLPKEKLYPNWYKSVNEKLKSPSSPKKKSKALLKRSGYAARCYLCNNNVKFENLQQHLYFGYVKCEDCDRVITSCLKYSNPTMSTTREDGNCTHAVVDWVMPPVENLKRLWDEDDDTLAESLNQYLKSLSALKSIQPYKRAFTCCYNYLKLNKYSTIKEKSAEDELLETLAKTSAPPTSSPSTSRKKLKTSKPRSVKKKKVESEEGPLLPENGFYLILREAIEECPECYESFDPKYLNFNTSNWLISIKCKGCQLLVCFILDPPDGSDSRLTIINGL